MADEHLQVPAELAQKKHVVLIFHGILSWGQWFAALKSAIEEREGLTAQGVKTKTVFLPQFLMPRWIGRWIVPWYSRESALQWVLGQILAFPSHEYRLSVIAHSFGTWIIAEIMRRYPSVHFERVVFVGSVVEDDFPWQDVIGRNVSRECVLLECGTRDPWPLLANAMTWGYGTTGTFGASQAHVRDRFQNCGHSALLSYDFCRDNWVEFLAGGPLTPSQWDKTHTYPCWMHWLNGLQRLKTLMALGIVAWICYFLYAYVLVPFVPLPASFVESTLYPPWKTPQELDSTTTSSDPRAVQIRTRLDKWRRYLGEGIEKANGIDATATDGKFGVGWFESRISGHRIETFSYVFERSDKSIDIVEVYAFLVASNDSGSYAPTYRQMKPTLDKETKEIEIRGLGPNDSLLCFVLAKKNGGPIPVNPSAWQIYLRRK